MHVRNIRLLRELRCWPRRRTSSFRDSQSITPSFSCMISIIDIALRQAWALINRRSSARFYAHDNDTELASDPSDSIKRRINNAGPWKPVKSAHIPSICLLLSSSPSLPSLSLSLSLSLPLSLPRFPSQTEQATNVYLCAPTGESDDKNCL